MTTELVIAPAASGKTRYCIDRIRAVRHQDPLSPIRVILPNRPQVDAFNYRLAAAGGAIGVHSGTFLELYRAVLATGGLTPGPRLEDPVRYRLLRAILDELHAGGRLSHYATLVDKPGFLVVLGQMISQLKRARVAPPALAQAVSGQGARLEELAAIYGAYQGWLISQGWVDTEGLGWLAVEALEEALQLGASWRLLVVDGFGQLDPTQLAVLQRLAGRVGECLVTLTGSPNPGRRLAHRRFDRLRSTLEAALSVTARPLPGARVHLAPELARLEEILFEPQAEIGARAQARTRSAGGEAVPEGGDRTARSGGDDLAGGGDRPRSGGDRRADGAVDAGRPPTARRPALELLEAPSPAAEVRAALRWIKQRLAHDGLVRREVAILAYNLEAYRPLLEEVAAEFGIRLHISAGAPLAANPAVDALLQLLHLPLQNWPPRQVTAAWQSPYFDWSELGIAADDAALLDAAARYGLVIEGLEEWRQALEDLATHPEEPPLEAGGGEESDTAPPAGHIPTGAAAVALQSKLEAFVARLTPPPRATIRDYVCWVEQLIGDDPAVADPEPSGPAENPDAGGACPARVIGRALHGTGEALLDTAARDAAALGRLKEALRALVLAEEVVGRGRVPGVAEAVPYDRFLEELAGVIQATSYKVRPPLGEETVLAAGVLAARGLTFRAVALLGLSEGQFPQAPAVDPLLSERDRAWLAQAGLVLEAPQMSDQVSWFYEAVTRASERLLITRPDLARDGAPWPPSPYWAQLLRLSPPQRRERPDDPLPAPLAASWPELLLAATHTLAAGSSDAEAGLAPESSAGQRRARVAGPDPVGQAQADGRWQAVLHGARVLAARLADGPGPYQGDLAALQQALAGRLDVDLWSASRLETYAACPHQFLARYLLELEPRVPVEPGFDAAQLGRIYHAILEKVYRKARREGQPTADRLLALLPNVANEVLATAPQTYGFRPTPLWPEQCTGFVRTLERTIRKLEEGEQKGDWSPVGLEVKFGIEDTPPLVLEDPNGNRIRVRGIIDRVDRNSAGQLCIIDYKTGSSQISARDLTEGRRLQLALYGRAAQALGLGTTAAGTYWHIQAARASSFRLEKYEGGVETAIETAVRHALAVVAAARQGQFYPRTPREGCPDWCAAADYCWQYSPRRF